MPCHVAQVPIQPGSQTFNVLAPGTGPPRVSEPGSGGSAQNPQGDPTQGQRFICQGSLHLRAALAPSHFYLLRRRGGHPRDPMAPACALPLSPESSISVEVASNASVVLEGENLRFSCSIRTAGRPQGRFSVIWQLVDRLNRRSNIMWLDRDGTVQPGASYWERSSFGGVQMEQVQPNSFSLGIFNSRKEDEGQYECHVTEWVRAVDGEWQVVGERRASTPIAITALGK